MADPLSIDAHGEPGAIHSAAAGPRGAGAQPDANRAARFPTSRLFATGLLVLTFLFGCFRMWNTDIWWHLRTGELIAQRGTVPATDWYTYTGPDQSWIDLHWGFQLAAAGVHALGGVPLLVLCKAALGTLAVALCLLASWRDWPVELAIVAWLPALVVLSGRLYVRPEIFTLVFLAAFLCVLFHAERRPRWLWLLPAVQLLWVNTQGLFVFGPLVLVFYWIQWLVRRFGGADDPAVGWRTLTGAGLLVLAACLLNPYGIRGALFPLELVGKLRGPDAGFYRQTITELASVSDFARRHGWFASPYLVMQLVSLALGAASFVALALYRRIDVFRLLLFAAFAYLGWQATRNNNHYALVAGCVTAWNFAEAWQRRRARIAEAVAGCQPYTPSAMTAAPRPAGNEGGEFQAADKSTRAATVHRGIAGGFVQAGRLGLAGVLVLVGWLVVTDRFYDWAGEGRRFGIGQRSDWYAHDACRFLGRPGMPRRALVHHLGQAAVYIYHNAPQRGVFIDGRLEVNSREVFQRYIEIMRRVEAGDPQWERLLTGGGKDAASVGPGPAILLDLRYSTRAILGLLGDPRWRCVYADRVAAVFLRNEVAETLSLPAVVPLPVGGRDAPVGKKW